MSLNKIETFMSNLCFKKKHPPNPQQLKLEKLWHNWTCQQHWNSTQKPKGSKVKQDPNNKIKNEKWKNTCQKCWKHKPQWEEHPMLAWAEHPWVVYMPSTRMRLVWQVTNSASHHDVGVTQTIPLGPWRGEVMKKCVCVGGRGGDGAKHAESMQWHILMVYLNCLAYLIFSPPIYKPTTKLVRELIKQVYFTKSIA
jgi:hypothetical protein